MNFPYPDEPTTIKAYQDRVKAEYNNVGRSFPDPNDSDAFRWFTRYGYDCWSMPEPESANKHIAELREALKGEGPPIPLPIPGFPTRRPLVGPLRIENKLFRDDTGPRRVMFCSWFPALRILRNDPATFYRQLDGIAQAGYQGVRVFLAVGGWMDFWDGREVAPVGYQKWYWTGNFMRTDRYGAVIDAWTEYDVLLFELAYACQQRKLRLHVTTGDMQIICPDPGMELELHRRFATVLASSGLENVVAFYEISNEFPLNRYGSDSPASIEQMGKIIAAVRQILPGVLTAQGAIPQDEEPATLEKASTHGDVCVSHTTRSPFETCLKRTFGLVYWEGDYRAFPKPFWQGEPAGPGADSYQRLDDPASLTALYAMHALTGQASNFFSGPSVRYREPLESVWGFRELPVILENHLPEDVAAWDHGSNRAGGIEYWWRGNDFATATVASWDTSPPRPIASWTFYTGTNVTTGTGTPPRMTGLLVGRFT